MGEKPLETWSAAEMPDRRWHAAILVSLGAGLGLALIAVAGCATSEQSAATPPPAEIAGTEHVCSSCHGPGGKNDNSTFPILAGQQKEYIETQLKAFRDKTRADPHAHTYMWGMAARLTDPQIDGLAAYFSAQSPAPGTPGDPTLVAAGQKIFQEGVPSADIPACNACHGEKAEGNGPYPRLAGQHKAYLERQLAAFASNARANEIMHENAKNLTPQQITELATFLSAQ